MPSGAQEVDDGLADATCRKRSPPADDAAESRAQKVARVDADCDDSTSSTSHDVPTSKRSVHKHEAQPDGAVVENGESRDGPADGAPQLSRERPGAPPNQRVAVPSQVPRDGPFARPPIGGEVGGVPYGQHAYDSVAPYDAEQAYGGRQWYGRTPWPPAPPAHAMTARRPQGPPPSAPTYPGRGPFHPPLDPSAYEHVPPLMYPPPGRFPTYGPADGDGRFEAAFAGTGYYPPAHYGPPSAPYGYPAHGPYPYDGRYVLPPHVGPMMSLMSSELWAAFHALGNEMIVTRSGRCLFPVLTVRVANLDPRELYSMMIDFVPADNNRWKYVGGAWVTGGRPDNPASPTVYVHPDSPNYGSFWMEKPVSFQKVKLTNRRMDTSPGCVVLTSLHRYLPRFHIVRVDTRGVQTGLPVLTATFPETVFYAVTAYQNERIKELKIKHNPFAKAFSNAPGRVGEGGDGAVGAPGGVDEGDEGDEASSPAPLPERAKRQRQRPKPDSDEATEAPS
eukprot:Opistho-1_new@32623